MTLPDLSGKATLDISDFRQGVATIKSSLATISQKAGTLKITADLRGAKQAITDIEVLRTAAAAPIRIGVNGEGLRDVGRIIKELGGQVKTVRDLWQTQAITDNEAALASQRLRNELLKLAAAEDANADSVLKATRAAAQAQRTMNQARGEVTKGGFAFNTSLGILEALGRLGGPAGAAAGLIGKYVTDGLSSGISKGAPKVAEETEGLSDDIVQALKRKLQIQSPSKVMEDLGRSIIDGLIGGFKSGRNELKAVLDEVASDIPNTFKGGVFDNDLAAPLVDGVGNALSVIPELFGKAFAEATDPAKEALADLGNEVEVNVTTAFEGLGAGFEKASAALSGVTVTASDTAQSLNDVTEGTTEAGGAATEAGNGFEKLGGFLAIAGAGVAAFGAALAVSLPLAAEFQTALRAISAESDLSAADLKEIGDGLIGVSNDLGVSAIELAKASYDIVGAGVKGAEANSAIVELARQSAQLAGAGMTDVATAGDTLTSALNAYGLSAASATRVSDALFQTTNVGKISLDQMGGSMNEVFPLAAALGVNLETLGAGVAALTSVGIPAAQAVTGIKSAFSNILKPSAEAGKAALALGVGFDAATLKAKGLPKFLEDITVAANGNTAVMSQLFGDVEAVNAVFALTSDVGAKKFTDALDAMAKANGATAQGFAEVADSYEQSQQRFKNSIQNIQIEFASRFLPTLTAVTDATTGFIKNIDTFGENTLVQFVAVTGGAVLLANTFIKLSVAIKEAAAATALFQAVTAAGGVRAYLISIGGLAGGMAALTTATVGATIAAAPLAVVALAVGTAFASWKLGKLIGELKLFGDATTSVNDKLTDFFAVTLFGADPQLIKGMREQEEAEQARALAAGDTADAYGEVAAAVRATAEAEAQAIEAQNAAAAAREAQIQIIKDQTETLEALQIKLSDRAFKLTLEGKSQIQTDLAELGREFEELRAAMSRPFEGDLQNPQLLAGLKTLAQQQAAEEASIREQFSDEAVKTATESARLTQQAELEAMRDGQAKKNALREQELTDIREEAAEKAATLTGFPEQKAQLESDARRVIAAKRKGWAAEDRQLAEDNARRVSEAENRAVSAVIDSMEDGLAKREALRAQELASLRQDVADRVAALAGDPGAQAGVQAAGDDQIAAKIREQNRVRLTEAREIAKLIVEAEGSARDGTIAAMEDGRAKREAIRAKELSGLRSSIAEKVKALADDPEAQRAVQAAGDDQIAAKIREQNQQRIRDEEGVQTQVVAARKSARDATLALITDEAQQRRVAREDELGQLRLTLQERLKAAEGYPAQQRAILTAAREQERSLQEKYAREDEADAKARAQRIADAYQRVDEARVGAERAGRENQAAQYELGLSRRLAAVRGNAEAEARIQQEAVARRAQLADQEARTQFGLDTQRLTRERDKALDNVNLSKEERESVWREYYANLGGLSGKFQADEKKRLQQREADEREAAERIRAARVQTALKPADDTAAGLSRLQFEQGLTDSLTQRLALEQLVQVAQQNQANLYADVLSQAEQLQLTEVERGDVADKLEGANRAVLTSQKSQLDYQRQINGEAQQLVDLYGKLVTLTGADAGLGAAQRDYADATDELGDAYARALPYLTQFRDASLKPDDFDSAKDALGGLVDALESQRQKLETLRGEYGRQRDALASIQDVLKGFGQEFGDTSLLDSAIQFNQSTYDQAKTALDVLLKGGKYDAAQLAEATKNLQSNYGGLKDSVVALGDARGKESEKEIGRVKRESDARLKALDDQITAEKSSQGVRLKDFDSRIAAARYRGDDYAAGVYESQRAYAVKTGELAVALLEKQKEAIVKSTGEAVTQLEAKAAAARDQAQKSLADRTGGLRLLLQGVKDGAATAGQGVDKLGDDVRKAEKEVAASAKNIRSSLSDAFTGLPAIAGRAGADSGKQFMAQLQKQLRTVKLPGITGPGAAALPSSRPAITNITQSFVFNGKDISGSVGPNMKTLLKALAAEADSECRRRGS